MLPLTIEPLSLKLMSSSTMILKKTNEKRTLFDAGNREKFQSNSKK